MNGWKNNGVWTRNAQKNKTNSLKNVRIVIGESSKQCNFFFSEFGDKFSWRIYVQSCGLLRRIFTVMKRFFKKIALHGRTKRKYTCCWGNLVQVNTKSIRTTYFREILGGNVFWWVSKFWKKKIDVGGIALFNTRWQCLNLTKKCGGLFDFCRDFQ